MRMPIDNGYAWLNGGYVRGPYWSRISVIPDYVKHYRLLPDVVRVNYIQNPPGTARRGGRKRSRYILSDQRQYTAGFSIRRYIHSS